jgi:hypothetical protein
VPSGRRASRTVLVCCAALVTVLDLAGCAPMTRAPETGPMWAFFTETDLALGPRGVVYTSSEIACETERRQRVNFGNPCVAVIVTPGEGYYAISLGGNVDLSRPSGITFGAADRERCEWLRSDLFRAFNARGDCESVAVKRVR